jgi:hypothetical protein
MPVMKLCSFCHQAILDDKRMEVTIFRMLGDPFSKSYYHRRHKDDCWDKERAKVLGDAS